MTSYILSAFTLAFLLSFYLVNGLFRGSQSGM